MSKEELEWQTRKISQDQFFRSAEELRKILSINQLPKLPFPTSQPRQYHELSEFQQILQGGGPDQSPEIQVIETEIPEVSPDPELTPAMYQDQIKTTLLSIKTDSGIDAWKQKSVTTITPQYELTLGDLWRLRGMHLDMVPRFIAEFLDESPTARFGRVEESSQLESFGIFREPKRRFASIFFHIKDNSREKLATSRSMYFSTRLGSTGIMNLSVEIITDRYERKLVMPVYATNFFSHFLVSFDRMVALALASSNADDVKISQRKITV